MTVQLALYKGKGDLLNAAIRWWCDSEYSHCELVVDGVCYTSSPMDGGVRKAVIDFKPEHWDFVDIPWANSQKIKRYFYQTNSNKYSYIGLIKSQIFNRNKQFKNVQFCSEWCARALGIPSPSIYSPHTLGVFLRWYNSR